MTAAVAVLAARGPDKPAARPTAPPAAGHAAPAPAPAHAHPPGPASAPATGQTRLNGCTTCLERNALVDPARYSGWNDTDVKKAYEAAAKYPDTVDLLHCYCECEESPKEHHKTLLTCFTTQHAAGCGICQHEALMAAKLKDQGVSDEEVERMVEAVHKTEGHRPTKGRGI